MNIHRHNVKRFRNCPNPDCSAHNPAVRFDEDRAPEYVKGSPERGPMMMCTHCSMVWYEELGVDIRRYRIIRNSASDWLEEPWIEVYTLPTRRKRKR